MAGPLATVAVVTFWAGLQIVGWALLHLPRVPAGFAQWRPTIVFASPNTDAGRTWIAGS